jgi:hypothetical protein
MSKGNGIRVREYLKELNILGLNRNTATNQHTGIRIIRE